MSKASHERRALRRQAEGVGVIDISAKGARARQDAPMFFNMGMEALAADNHPLAEEYFWQVLYMIPSQPEAPKLRGAIWHNLGIARLGQINYSGADEAFAKARRYDSSLGLEQQILLPMIYTGRVSNRDLLERHIELGESMEAKTPPPLPYPNVRDPDRKLRIGYCSGDFRRHPVMAFFEPLLVNHDRKAFEIFCYSQVVKPDEETVRIRRIPDAWRSTVGVTDVEMADMIRQDEIDILIDLAGHTAHSRLDAFARRPAPISATWMGYPHSTGLKSIDYRIVDDMTDPPGSEAQATEKLFRLPLGFSCYRTDPTAPPVSPVPSLSGEPIRFGSFNMHHKISPSTMKVWAKLLKAVPNSRLLVKSLGLDHQYNVQRLLDLAMDDGVDPDRFDILRPTLGLTEHLACYAQMDVGLDPFPYNGTTSTAEALWMGVPVVVMTGKRHSARVGASIMHQLGFDDLIAEDGKAYVEIAKNLAADTARLKELRATLRQRMQASPFCDGPGFARRFETGLREMWTTFCNTAQATEAAR